MDFGDILNAWEHKQKSNSTKKSMDNIIDKYLPREEDFRVKEENDNRQDQRVYLKSMAPQREIDLHGYTVKEALAKLNSFIEECRKEKIKKILIIHGKGHHSADGPVLRTNILQYIQKHHHTGEHGFASKKMGGRGALWVILR